MSENCPTCGRPIPTKRPTKQQARILRFVRSYVDAYGYGPSYREIANMLGVRALSTIHEHVANLRREGYLQPADPQVPRATLPLTSTTED